MRAISKSGSNATALLGERQQSGLFARAKSTAATQPQLHPALLLSALSFDVPQM
jgi:hypothetical protein